MRNRLLTTAVMIACAGISLNASADESTTISGKMFADVTSLTQESNSTEIAPSGMGMDVKRFYLGVNKDFGDMWSANLTSDFGYDSYAGLTQVFVKKAYVQAKVSDAVTVRAGAADMPWGPYVEGLYGMRYVENTLLDRLKFSTSSDWGLHLFGKTSDGTVNYAVSLINGGGFKNPLTVTQKPYVNTSDAGAAKDPVTAASTSRTKGMDIEARVGFRPINGLDLGIGYYNGKLGKDYTGTTATVETASRLTAVAAYKTDQYSVGAEYFSAENGLDTTKAADKADGSSLYGSYKLQDNVSVFARYDSANPNKTTAPNLTDTYYNVGIGYQPRKNIDLALVYKQETVENGSISTSNGTIGGTTDGTYNEIGVWSQVSF
ncbi:MAG: hypothetical protein HY940_05400 [Gammaproteobacteria bacterium]|nr:hypothetical protein [Gammaproteobacteria bacterium]